MSRIFTEVRVDSDAEKFVPHQAVLSLKRIEPNMFIPFGFHKTGASVSFHYQNDIRFTQYDIWQSNNKKILVNADRYLHRGSFIKRIFCLKN